MNKYQYATAAILAVLAPPVVAEEPVGDDEHRYEAPLLQACELSQQLGLYLSDGSCLLVSGRLQSAFGYDSRAGFVSFHTELLRIAAVQQSDVGTVFAVATLMNSGWWSLDGSATVEDELRLQEAFVSIGDATRITAGKVTSVLNMDDDEPLDWLGRDYGEEVDWTFPVWVTSYNYPLTSAAIQLVTPLAGNLTAAFALEELDGSRPYTPPNGRLVASLAYQDEATSAHISWAGFGVLAGQLDAWGAHFGLVSDQDHFRTTIAGSIDSANHWEALVSGAVDVGTIEIAATVGAEAGNGFSAGASVSIDPTEQLTLQFGARSFVYAYETEPSHQVAGEAILRTSDVIAASVELGLVDDQWSSVTYGAFGLDWHPGGGIKAKAKATVTSESRYKIESELIRPFY